MGLNPVSFKYKNNQNNGVGLVAQEVLSLMKDLNMDYPLVNYDSKRDMYMIPYGGYISILAGAIQYQDDRLRKLEEKIENPNL